MANPFDMALNRLKVDLHLPPLKRQNYRDIWEAVVRIGYELKFFGMWKGYLPTLGLALVNNMINLVAYNSSKEMLTDFAGKYRS